MKRRRSAGGAGGGGVNEASALGHDGDHYGGDGGGGEGGGGEVGELESSMPNVHYKGGGSYGQATAAQPQQMRPTLPPRGHPILESFGKTPMRM
jgi:hypothetical protein